MTFFSTNRNEQIEAKNKYVKTNVCLNQDNLVGQKLTTVRKCNKTLNGTNRYKYL